MVVVVPVVVGCRGYGMSHEFHGNCGQVDNGCDLHDRTKGHQAHDQDAVYPASLKAEEAPFVQPLS